MAAVRDSLCNMEPVQIPRPQISGLQFIPTRGRLGFYATIRRDGEKYGVGMKPIGPRRPVLSDGLFTYDSNISKSSNPITDEAGKKQNMKSSSEQVKQDLQSVKLSSLTANTSKPVSLPALDNKKTSLNKQ
ncbi:hypothetical protein LOAG_04144 [Loa loa]|uniref:CAP-Gly domain-containing protein n=1 Tax=Loa loa TaxID=7209 RepID=A0A1I7VW74_LOALO|nr:hypothetical protein LOAG_04144 [Loa loa]EFO24341.1 hypothetical protein LOAG_04144 [Loa loa]